MKKHKDNPSRAQILHRHKFITIGAVESMHSRLHQLITDKMIPSGGFKLSLIAAHDHLHEACKLVRDIKIEDYALQQVLQNLAKSARKGL